jgi:hypothetical protein
MTSGEGMTNLKDNLIEVLPGRLIDPDLKITLTTSGHKESYGFREAMLHLTYDPEITPGQLVTPPSPEQRARRLSIPTRAHLADEPLLFQSDKRVQLASFAIKWDEPTDVLQFLLDRDSYNIQLVCKNIEDGGYPFISDHAQEVILYSLRSLAKMHEIRGEALSVRYANLKRIDVCVQNDVATFLNINPKEMPKADPNLTCIASRELGQ